MCFVFTGKKEMGLLCIWANTKAISQSQVRNKAFDLLDYFIVDFHLYSCAHLMWLCVCVFVWDVFSRRLQMACATPIKLISSRHISHEITWKNCNCDQTELNEVKKNVFDIDVHVNFVYDLNTHCYAKWAVQSRSDWAALTQNDAAGDVW